MENLYLCFIPECFFDTIFFKKILNTNARLKHTKGCFNVVNRFRDINGKKGDLFDSFGVGMVDKDKRELDYLGSCDEIFSDEYLILWKERGKHHYIIQITSPLELWVLRILNDVNKQIAQFGFESSPKTLKRQIKDNIDSEKNEKLNALILFIVNSEHQAIRKLRIILVYLSTMNYEVDIEKLKEKLI